MERRRANVGLSLPWLSLHARGPRARRTGGSAARTDGVVLSPKVKQLPLIVCTAAKRVANDLGGDERIRNSVASVAEREVRAWPIGMRADVRKAVPGLAERSRPGECHVQRDVGK